MPRLPDRRRHIQLPDLRDERGIALAVAVLALVVIGALVAGTFLSGRLEQRSGLNSLFSAQAFEAAEAGAASTVAAWNAAAFNARPAGVDTVLPSMSIGGGARFTVTISRINPTMFYLRSMGERRSTVGATLARRTVGLFLRAEPPVIDTTSVLSLGSGLDIGAATVLDGSDVVPAGWGAACAPPGSALDPLRTDSSTVLTDSGPPPIIVRDTAVGPGTFRSFGTTTFDDLAATASIVASGTLASLAPSAVGAPARCDVSNPGNWGEPRTGVGSVPACFDYWPVIHAPGDLSVGGGRGQGLLLVRGDLALSGSVEFDGVVIVLGRITMSGGATIRGAVLVAGGTGQSVLATGSLIGASRCAVRRALSAAALPEPLSGRAWAQLF